MKGAKPLMLELLVLLPMLFDDVLLLMFRLFIDELRLSRGRLSPGEMEEQISGLKSSAT